MNILITDVKYAQQYILMLNLMVSANTKHTFSHPTHRTLPVYKITLTHTY